jgi:hypothetical protein
LGGHERLRFVGLVIVVLTAIRPIVDLLRSFLRGGRTRTLLVVRGQESDVEGFEPDELDKLEEWIEMFEGKYRHVGRLLGTP